MKTISRILSLTITKEYYRQNAVFIFAVMMFSFGFLRAEEHKTIIKSAFKFAFTSGLNIHWLGIARPKSNIILTPNV